ARDAWRAELPIADFEAHRPWIDRVAAGEPDVLFPGAPRALEPTGGTSGVEKLVPITGALLAEFARATTPWVDDLLRSDPRLRGGRAYWAVSPPTRVPGSRTAGGVPIGLEHDSDYFPRVLARLIDATLGLPRATSQVRDLRASRYVTLLALLAMDDLALVSVWSPSFLTLLIDALDRDWTLLLDDLARGTIDPTIDVGPPALREQLASAIGAHPARAHSLVQRFGRDAPPTDVGQVWPRLAVVSCWTHAQAAHAVPALRVRLPHVRLQPKGLLATEGVTSVPWRAHADPVLAVASHLLEFLPLGADPLDGSGTLDAHELDAGQRYEVLLTTAGGLTRYRTFDVVEVTGHVAGSPTPTVRFTGRADHASDLAGEKLTPDAVHDALVRARARVAAATGEDAGELRATGVAPFALLVPDLAAAPPAYVLVVDAVDAPGAGQLARTLDAELRLLHHYDLCRDLGQLGPVTHLAVPHAARAYEAAAVALQQRAGSRKDTELDARAQLLPLLVAAARN
ncbi:MAG: auxin-responsive-like protein, partial [Thermoleophilia bacterium]|nr:auxin-responsive-like protein [Thermoleophilia bacterium]